MSSLSSILDRSLVQVFYRQHAGFFMFVFLLFFGIVAPSQQAYYHYHLILETLQSPPLMGCVMAAWLLYGCWCAYWVRRRLARPSYRYLRILPGSAEGRKLERAAMGVQWALLAPIVVYASAVVIIGLWKGYTGAGLLVAGYIVAIVRTGGRVYAKWLRR